MKLIVTDLDGTFLDNKGTYDKLLFSKVWSEMKSKGIELANWKRKQSERIEELFVSNNVSIRVKGDSATRITHNKKLIREFPMEKNIALQIIEEIRQFDSNLITIICTNKGAFVNSDIKDQHFDIVRGSYANITKISSVNDLIGKFLKITVYDSMERSNELKEHLKLFDKHLYIVASDPAWLDVTDKAVHKGKTVEELQKILKITKEDTMSFGDGENDVELMDIAKYSFAMKNASENTKEAADFITKSNDENGVLKTIQKIIDLI